MAQHLLPISRRNLLRTMGTGLGMVGLFPLLAGTQPRPSPLAPREPHFPAKAKHIIHLFLNGGGSQVDSFDYKPELAKYHGKPYPGGNLKTERKTGTLMQSPFEFKKFGESGVGISEIFSQLGERVDDICVINSMYTDLPFHEPSLLMLNCGQRIPGTPSMGSWVTYGLGTENQNLPGYVVLGPGVPVIGPQLWSSPFCRALTRGPISRTISASRKTWFPTFAILT